MPLSKEEKKVYDLCYYRANKARINASNRAWLASPKGAAHKFRKKLRKYGLTQYDWDNLWAAQGGRCAGCLTELSPDSPNTHIDHCHGGGHVRGILCSSCNLAIGHLKNDPATLRRLASYLSLDIAMENHFKSTIGA